MYNYFTINKIKISEIYFHDIKNIISASVNNRKQVVFSYVNQGNIVQSKKNAELREALSNADYNYADGTGIFLASKILAKTKFKNRFVPTDYCFELFEYIFSNNYKLVLLGSKQEILNQAKLKLQKEYKNCSIVGTFNGYSDLVDNQKLIKEINSLNPDVILVALGSPKQELWMFKNRSALNANFILSVGELIHEVIGVKVRGPKIFQKIGLEWIFRLLANPINYFRRYIIGIPKFIYIIFEEYSMKK